MRVNALARGQPGLLDASSGRAAERALPRLESPRAVASCADTATQARHDGPGSARKTCRCRPVPPCSPVTQSTLAFG